MPVKNPRDGWQTQKQTKLNQRQIKHRNISKINNKKKKTICEIEMDHFSKCAEKNAWIWAMPPPIFSTKSGQT